MTELAVHEEPLGSRASAAQTRDGSESDQGIRPGRVTLIVLLIGLLITVSVAWTAWTLNRHNEHRLLEVQTRQAAAVLSSTILSLQDPLETALQIESATAGSSQQFSQFAASYVAQGKLFSSAILWMAVGTSLTPVQVVGATPLLTPGSQRSVSFIHKALSSSTLVVTSVRSDGVHRIGYAIANPKDPRLVVYAERAIPANREVPVESNSAFSDLNFATYLGHTTNLSALATTDLPVGELPITGDTVHTSIPFGDSSITLVAGPRGPLGGTIGGALPWIFLVGGCVLTAATAFVAYQLARRRRSAVADAQTIAGLYREFGRPLRRAALDCRNPTAGTSAPAQPVDSQFGGCVAVYRRC